MSRVNPGSFDLEGGIIPESGPVIIGDAGSTSHTLTANDDLYVSGKLEVDGSVYFDGATTFTANVTFIDNRSAIFGTSNDASIGFRNEQTADSLTMGLDATSRIFIISDIGDVSYNFAHSAQTNPTLIIHSANQATDEWISFAHDQTDAVIKSGTGSIKIIPGSGPVIIGDAGSTNHSLVANDDLFVSGKFEVDGAVFFDGTTTHAGNNIHTDNISAVFGSGNDAALGFRNNQTVDTLMMAVDATSDTLLICEIGDIGYNFNHGAQTNPTLFIHSTTQSATEWISFTHDQTDAVINWGTGLLDLAGASMATATVTHDDYFQVQINGVTKNVMCGS